MLTLLSVNCPLPAFVSAPSNTLFARITGELTVKVRVVPPRSTDPENVRPPLLAVSPRTTLPASRTLLANA